MTNNDISFTATLTYQNAHTDLVVAITTDRYAAETSWDIKSSSGATIHAVPANICLIKWGSGQTVQTLVQMSAATNECYTFSIKTLMGMASVVIMGNGSYGLATDGNGVVLASGGQFDDEESGSFRTASKDR